MSAMSGQPIPTDATEEQVKDAVWVVFDSAGSMVMGGPMGGAPNPLGQKLAEHLKQGG
jgi:hypothetical protein